jgi:hypothetical protein
MYFMGIATSRIHGSGAIELLKKEGIALHDSPGTR